MTGKQKNKNKKTGGPKTTAPEPESVSEPDTAGTRVPAIVGIGASAGGLEELFGNMPVTLTLSVLTGEGGAVDAIAMATRKLNEQVPG